MKLSLFICAGDVKEFLKHHNFKWIITGHKWEQTKHFHSNHIDLFDVSGSICHPTNECRSSHNGHSYSSQKGFCWLLFTNEVRSKLGDIPRYLINRVTAFLCEYITEQIKSHANGERVISCLCSAKKRSRTNILVAISIRLIYVVAYHP